MYNVRVVTDVAECRAVWEEVIPRETIWDLWEVRECFHRYYKRPLYFITAEEEGCVRGLLPLSWIDETGSYGYFPGETWKGKTWLEQNRIHGDDSDIRTALLDFCPGSYYLRYLTSSDSSSPGRCDIDEIGYLFSPPMYEYNMGNYLGEFSRKSRKRLQRDLAAFDECGLSYRYDDLADFDVMVKMNRARFGGDSYFSDLRFVQSFRGLMELLHRRGWMRITTVLIDDKIAAVDLGCIFNGVYTLLGGGTHEDFPGVAKLINIHHMRLACERRLSLVDFLCGGFSWKTIFHLSPRPLYLLSEDVTPFPKFLTGGEEVAKRAS